MIYCGRNNFVEKIRIQEQFEHLPVGGSTHNIREEEKEFLNFLTNTLTYYDSKLMIEKSVILLTWRKFDDPRLVACIIKHIAIVNDNVRSML